DKGRISRAYLPVTMASGSGAAAAAGAGAGAAVRGYSTWALGRRRTPASLAKRGYATSAIGLELPVSTEPKRLALIGARGYTGQALVSLLSGHPYLDLAHVSSRVLAGEVLEGYEKQKMRYSNLLVKD